MCFSHFYTFPKFCVHVFNKGLGHVFPFTVVFSQSIVIQHMYFTLQDLHKNACEINRAGTCRCHSTVQTVTINLLNLKEKMNKATNWPLNLLFASNETWKEYAEKPDLSEWWIDMTVIALIKMIYCSSLFFEKFWNNFLMQY